MANLTNYFRNITKQKSMIDFKSVGTVNFKLYLMQDENTFPNNPAEITFNTINSITNKLVIDNLSIYPASKTPVRQGNWDEVKVPKLQLGNSVYFLDDDIDDWAATVATNNTNNIFWQSTVFSKEITFSNQLSYDAMALVRIENSVETVVLFEQLQNTVTQEANSVKKFYVAVDF